MSAAATLARTLPETSSTVVHVGDTYTFTLPEPFKPGIINTGLRIQRKVADRLMPGTSEFTNKTVVMFLSKPYEMQVATMFILRGQLSHFRFQNGRQYSPLHKYTNAVDPTTLDFFVIEIPRG